MKYINGPAVLSLIKIAKRKRPIYQPGRRRHDIGLNDTLPNNMYIQTPWQINM